METLSVSKLHAIGWCSLLISFIMFWKIPFLSFCSLVIFALTYTMQYFFLVFNKSHHAPTKNDDDTEGCVIAWEIENLNKCCLKKGNFIKSPIFTADSLDATKWSLYLYPKGFGNSELPGVFLKREKDHYLPNVIQVLYQITILGKGGSTLEEKPVYVRSFEQEKFTLFFVFGRQQNASGNESKSFLPEDSVTIQCKIWKKDHMPVVPEILSARSTYKLHYKSFFWRIYKYSNLKPSKSGIVKKYSDHVINFRLMSSQEGLESEKKLDVDISSSDTSIYYFSFKASITDSEGKKLECGIQEHYGDDLQKGVSVPLSISRNTLTSRKDLYLPKDILCLACEYIFSTVTTSYECDRCGTLSSSETRGCTKKKAGHQLTSALMDDLKSMYSDAILCDVEIRTSTQTFSAHKAILSSRSTVFRRMFDNDMKEKNSGHVDIEDLEVETVRRMLAYLYTDSLGDLEMEDASKLYSAADKYDISSLKRRCSSFLKENVCPKTVCDVLDLADLHQDDDLKSAVQNYILEHAKEVFDTQEWKHFMATNIELAAEVMYQKVKGC